MLVHGEFERNDMVQYFGEQFAGFCLHASRLVQSYGGSRYVRPPIIYGDVSRPGTDDGALVAICAVADRRPVKACLTGPVTILNWSFVRDDICV